MTRVPHGAIQSVYFTHIGCKGHAALICNNMAGTRSYDYLKLQRVHGEYGFYAVSVYHVLSFDNQSPCGFYKGSAESDAWTLLLVHCRPQLGKSRAG